MHATTIGVPCYVSIGQPHGAKRILMQQHCKGGRAAASAGGGGGRGRGGSKRTLSAFWLLCCTNMDHYTASAPSFAQGCHETKSNFGQVASSIGLATILSKALGLLRETLLAAVYGVGPVMTAFSYSSIFPGFFMAVLGGINGPLQITMLGFISKREEKEGRLLAGKVSTAIGLISGVLSLAIFLSSGAIINATAPGLLISPDGLIARNLAVLQLQIMAPCTFLAGLIGVGFGTLSAAGRYEALSLSPVVSNISVIFGVVVYVTLSQFRNTNFTEGAIFLALGVTVGAISQWIWQAKAQQELGLRFLPFEMINFKDRDLQEVLLALLPAIVGSGMLQLATFTDMYFASFIPGAAAGLGYAYLLVMAPMGILSSSILLPMSSLFARVLEPSNRAELKNRINEGLLILMATTLPITAVGLTLSKPLVEIALQRFAFDASASALVSSLVACYVAGAFASLARDLLTQLFYALGDGNTPCYITVVALLINALLDWQLVQIGPVGLVLATIFVNGLSVLAMLMFLSIKLQGLPFEKWSLSFLKMMGASIVSGVVTKLGYTWLIRIFPYVRVLKLMKACSLVIASFMGVAAFSLVLRAFGKAELQLLIRLFWSQLNHHKNSV